MNAKLLAAKARIAAIESRVAGMLADNTYRTMRDETIAYDGSCFREAEAELTEIAESLERKDAARELALSRGDILPYGYPATAYGWGRDQRTNSPAELAAKPTFTEPPPEVAELVKRLRYCDRVCILDAPGGQGTYKELTSEEIVWVIKALENYKP
ncbi:MAG: hypothetical protein WA003_15710 [Desulfuromonadaceae bacterium]